MVKHLHLLIMGMNAMAFNYFFALFFFSSEMALLDGGHSELHKDVCFPVWFGTATTWHHRGLGFG